jgi:hypothetical protein
MPQTTRLSEERFLIAANAPIEAQLSYLVPDGRRPVSYACAPPLGIPGQSVKYALCRTRIFNAREPRPVHSLDHEAFAVVQHVSAVADFCDPAQIQPHCVAGRRQAAPRRRCRAFPTRRLHESRCPALRRQSARLPASASRLPISTMTTRTNPDQRGRALSWRKTAPCTCSRAGFWRSTSGRPVRGLLKIKLLAVCDAASPWPDDLVPATSSMPTASSGTTRELTTAAVLVLRARAAGDDPHQIP